MVCPDSIDRADVPTLPCHKAGEERRYAETNESRRVVTGDQKGKCRIIVDLSTILHQGKSALRIIREDDSDQACENDDEGNSHLEEGGKDRSHSCCPEIFRREGSLHDEEVGCPVAKREYKAQSEDDSSPGNDHAIQ